MKSWTKIILGFGIGATLIGAALAGYGFETGGLADLEKNVETLSTTRYHKVSLDTFSKVTIDSSAFDVVVAKETWTNLLFLTQTIAKLLSTMRLRMIH